MFKLPPVWCDRETEAMTEEENVTVGERVEKEAGEQWPLLGLQKMSGEKEKGRQGFMRRRRTKRMGSRK